MQQVEDVVVLKQIVSREQETIAKAGKWEGRASMGDSSGH